MTLVSYFLMIKAGWGGGTNKQVNNNYFQYFMGKRNFTSNIVTSHAILCAN
jgi:hypothetical protein